MGVGNEVHASMEVYTKHTLQSVTQKGKSLTLAGQECALVRLVEQALLGLRLLLLLLCLVLLQGQQLLLLLLLGCKQLLQGYQLLLLLSEGNQLLGVAHSEGAAQQTCQGRLLGAGGEVGGAHSWAAQAPQPRLKLLHLFTRRR